LLSESPHNTEQSVFEVSVGFSVFFRYF